MRRYNLNHITDSGRKPLFWNPWGFWKWFWRVLVFALCLGLFLLLFCIPVDRTKTEVIELHEGDVEITLKWANADDLDLHCIDPDGEEIYFSHKHSRSGGELDHDMNVGGGLDGREAIEHIYWPHNGAPSGRYKVSVVLYKKCSHLQVSEFSVRFKATGCATPVDTTIHRTYGSSRVVEIGTFNID